MVHLLIDRPRRRRARSPCTAPNWERIDWWRLGYAIKRGRGIEDCRKALDMTAMLEVKDAHPLDPKPISVADFWAIVGAAEAAKDDTFVALLLTSLNLAMYGGE